MFFSKVNILTLTVSISSQCQRQAKGQARAGMNVSECLHSSRNFPLTPPDLSHFTVFSCFPVSLLLQSCNMEALVTPLMTAAVRLYYQLHILTDTLTNPGRCFYSPSGNVYTPHSSMCVSTLGVD